MGLHCYVHVTLYVCVCAWCLHAHACKGVAIAYTCKGVAIAYTCKGVAIAYTCSLRKWIAVLNDEIWTVVFTS
jgi:hypothetical protein